MTPADDGAPSRHEFPTEIGCSAATRSGRRRSSTAWPRRRPSSPPAEGATGCATGGAPPPRQSRKRHNRRKGTRLPVPEPPRARAVPPPTGREGSRPPPPSRTLPAPRAGEASPRLGSRRPYETTEARGSSRTLLPCTRTRVAASFASRAATSPVAFHCSSASSSAERTASSPRPPSQVTLLHPDWTSATAGISEAPETTCKYPKARPRCTPIRAGAPADGVRVPLLAQEILG